MAGHNPSAWQRGSANSRKGVQGGMNRQFFRVFLQVFTVIFLLLAIPSAAFSVSNIMKTRQELQDSYVKQQLDYAKSFTSVVEDKFNDLKDVCFFIQKEEWLTNYCKGTVDLSDYDLIHRQKYCGRLNTLLANAQVAKDIAIIVPGKDTIISAFGWFTQEQYDFTYYPVRLDDFLQGGMAGGAPIEVYSASGAGNASSGYLLPIYFNFYGNSLPYRVLFLVDKRLFSDYVARVSSGSAMRVRITLNGYDFYSSSGGTVADYEYVSPITNMRYEFDFDPISNLYANSLITNNLLIIMVIFTFLLLLSFLFAYALARPINRLMAKALPHLGVRKRLQASGESPMPPRSGNVFRLLEASIDGMAEERTRLGVELDRYKRIVSNDELLFNILISDDTEQYVDEIRDFWPWFNTAGYCSVMLFNCKSGDMAEANLGDLLDKIEAAMPKQSVEYRLLNILNSDAALLLYFGENAQAIAKGHYDALYQTISQAVEATLEGYFISRGSIERGILGIRTSYHQARREYLNHIYFSGDDEATVQLFYPISMELQLINYMKLSKRDQCMDILNVVFNQNKSLPLSDPQRIKLSSVIFDTLLRFSVENDIDTREYRLLFQKLLGDKDYARLSSCIQGFCQYLCDCTAKCRKADESQERTSLYEYVLNNYYDPNMSLQLLSTHFSVPMSTLSKQFKETAGCNFYDFLCKTRVEKALQLIKENKHTITEIGRIVGYDNYASFKRAFVKFIGVSPSDFKKLESR